MPKILSVCSQLHLRGHLAIFAHPAGGLVHKVQSPHYLRWCHITSKNTSKTRSNLRSHKKSPEEGSIWPKKIPFLPWSLGHGTHSKRILDGKAAWKKVIWKIKGVVFITLWFTVPPEHGGEVVIRSLHLFHPPSTCQFHKPSRRASPQLISAWALHTAGPTATCWALLAEWALWPDHKHSARYPQR